MRRRSYEYYEVVSDITGKNHSVHCRGDYAACLTHLNKLTPTVDDNGNLYLVRCQLIESRKSDTHQNDDGTVTLTQERYKKYQDAEIALHRTGPRGDMDNWDE